jgi:PTH2 family peptidyl-tRNA hydrolase
MKQVILVRQDLQLPKGKLAAQVSHASVECFDKTSREKREQWQSEGMKKVVLKVKDLEELQLYATKARMAKIISAVITDAGRTVVEPGTVTCLGIGPDEDEKIDAITGSLKML